MHCEATHHFYTSLQPKHRLWRILHSQNDERTEKSLKGV